MDLAWISVGALIVAVTLSMVTTINVGVVCLAFAWIVGVLLGGMSVGDILDGFPTQLFITLAGVTLLFSMARGNGTLERVTERAVRLCRGHTGILPIMFFFLALGLSTIGPGSIGATALLAPPAMAVAQRTGISFFIMAVMIGNGALAGSLSPFSPTGVVANSVMARMGFPDLEWITFRNNILGHTLVAFGGYAVLGGLKLFGRGRASPAAVEQPVQPMEPRHWLTVSLIALLLIGVIGFELEVGMTALTAATILTFTRAADEKEAIRGMPWGVMLMVTGVTVLITLMEKTQGLNLFTDLLVRLSTTDSVTAVVAFVTGVVSVYSSTSGVVLPAFLPTVPGLVERLGGLDPIAVASAMNVGSHLVDLSPLSTTGALCLAGVPAGVDPQGLFNKLLAWGLSMTVVGAVVCWLMFSKTTWFV
ncbi:MAG: C4-dicarboxylate ABC transporter [Acidobacteria bacterium]|nr:C4-dicarboxylate ABC transporter [Acidobacteriota bacterium]